MHEINDEQKLLLPKVDFIFKKIFGEEKNKELLQDFLANIFGLPKEKITGLTLTNNELLKDYEDDRKGMLDVRVEMSNRLMKECFSTSCAKRCLS